MRSSAALLALLLCLGACGRYFHTELQPIEAQGDGMKVNDDGSVTWELERLAITLKPMTDAELNRQFASAVEPGEVGVNPYTFGDWTDLGEDFTPKRFTVFRLQVENYQFAKVRIDPVNTYITTANDRAYGPVTYAQLYDYYQAHWVGRTGHGRTDFRARTDILRQTMYSGTMVFSGSEEQGYLVFPRLDDDVERTHVHIEGIALRFDYADEPVETADLTFTFGRDILRGYTAEDAGVVAQQ